MIIGNDVIISIDSYIRTIFDEHFFGTCFSLERKQEEMNFLIVKLKDLGIKIISYKVTEKSVRLHYQDTLNRKSLLELVF